MKIATAKKKRKIPYSKIVMTLTIDIHILEQVINAIKDIPDKTLINKFKRAYAKRKAEQDDYFKRVTEKRLPGSNN